MCNIVLCLELPLSYPKTLKTNSHIVFRETPGRLMCLSSFKDIVQICTNINKGGIAKFVQTSIFDGVYLATEFVSVWVKSDV